MFGENGGIVEIDESQFRKPKNNRGHNDNPERWVFGLYDRNTRLGHVEFVKARTANDLAPIIIANCHPGAHIFSDCWSAYLTVPHGPAATDPRTYISKITTLPVQPPFQHSWVNHSRMFVNRVDPALPVHTNGVESMWQQAKRAFKRMNGTEEHMIPSHLDEWLFRNRVHAENHLHDHPDADEHYLVYEKLLGVIADWFVVE